MATANINSVYPPIVESSLPAFPVDNESLFVTFTLPLVVNFDNVKNIAVRIVQQSNNKSVLNSNTYYDGIMYLNTNNIKKVKTNVYGINIYSKDIIIGNTIGWHPDTFYKIQIRFGYNELTYLQIQDPEERRKEFFKWKKSQAYSGSFSEWSNVIIAKSIQKPTVRILNNIGSENHFTDTVLYYSQNVESTRFPEFQGGYYNSAEEPLYKYRFSLYEGMEAKNVNEAKATTGWLQYNGSGNEMYTGLVKHTFKESLDPSGSTYYTVVFDIQTKNGYELSSSPYTFTIVESYLSSLQSLSFVVKDNTHSNFYKNLFYNASESTFLAYQKMFNLSPLAYFSRVEGSDIYYFSPQDENVLECKLSLEERISKAASLNQDLDTDENGCLKIYIRNNPYQKEVWMEEDPGVSEDPDNPFGMWVNVQEYQNLDGVYYLIRASEKTNYTVWEDLARFEWFNETAYNDKLTLLYEDFTVESGVNYKYGIQRQGVSGMRSAPKFELKTIESSPGHCSNFQHCFIYADGIQLKVDLDVNIKQFKRTKLFSKQDSLNSKYPVILRNGLADYAEFSFAGKISLHSDEDGTFFMRNDEKGGYFYNGDLVISSNKYLEIYNRELNATNHAPREVVSKFNFDHTNENIYMERIYREHVEKFLNNGGYKLYKSPTEGNMIVTLVNVSLTPNKSLGRIIADFSSLIYEIADNTLDNMKLYNINSLDVITNNMLLAVGEWQSKYRTVPGQVRGAFDGQYVKSMEIDYDTYIELLNEGMLPQLYFNNIKDKFITYQKLPTNIVNYLYTKKHVQKDSLIELKQGNNPCWHNEYDNIIEWIRTQEEREISDEKKYQLNKVSQIWVELYPKYNIEQELVDLQAKTFDTKINKLKKQIQIAKYKLMLEQYELSQSNIITMVLNGEEINMMPGRIYHLDDVDVQTLYLKYTRPILINYLAEIEEVDFLPKVTINKQTIANWGQLSGVFTENDKILDRHKIDRNNELLTASEGKNYNLYQSLDILDIIKEKSRERILSLQGLNLSKTYNELDLKIDSFLKEENLIKLSYEEQIEIGNNLLKDYQPLSTIEINSSQDAWTNAEEQYVIYKFEGLEAIEIEGSSNTEIMFYAEQKYDVDKKEPYIGGNVSKTLIGPTNKFVLRPLDQGINQLRFTKPSFGLINFRARVSLEIKGLYHDKQTGEVK